MVLFKSICWEIIFLAKLYKYIYIYIYIYTTYIYPILFLVILICRHTIYIYFGNSLSLESRYNSRSELWTSSFSACLYLYEGKLAVRQPASYTMYDE